MNFGVVAVFALLWFQQSDHAAALPRRAAGGERGADAARDPATTSRGRGRRCSPGCRCFMRSWRRSDERSGLPALRLCISAGAPLPARVGEAFTPRYRREGAHVLWLERVRGHRVRRAWRSARMRRGSRDCRCGMWRYAPDRGGGQIEVRSEAVGDGYYPGARTGGAWAGRFVPATWCDWRRVGCI